jgi:hypothetical protein
MEDTNEENLHDGDANSTESISNSSIVSSEHKMLELFDDNALDELEVLLVVDIDLANEHKEWRGDSRSTQTGQLGCACELFCPCPQVCQDLQDATMCIQPSHGSALGYGLC